VLSNGAGDGPGTGPTEARGLSRPTGGGGGAVVGGGGGVEAEDDDDDDEEEIVEAARVVLMVEPRSGLAGDGGRLRGEGGSIDN